MALTHCPECGQQISDKARSCVHCGKIFMNQNSLPICNECGKEIPLDVKECPFCGYPIENNESVSPENEPNEPSEPPTVVKSRKILLISIIFIVIMMGIFLLSGPSLNEDEKLIYQGACQLKNMLNDPKSFRLYDEMLIIRLYSEEGDLQNELMVIEFGGSNGFGAIVREEALFKNGNFIMSYSDELVGTVEDDWYWEQAQTKALVDYSIAAVNAGKDDDLGIEIISIDSQKIKSKMGLG